MIIICALPHYRKIILLMIYLSIELLNIMILKYKIKKTIQKFKMVQYESKYLKSSLNYYNRYYRVNNNNNNVLEK